MPIAFTRALSPRIAECELSFRVREPIDYDRAVSQHEAYERKLESLGCKIVRIDPAPDHPDGVFVEDAAIILEGFAIITRPGAESRRGETESVSRALTPYLLLRRIEAPATLDGGDVLRAGKTLYVGRSQRTNDQAIEQLRSLATGFDVVPIDFHGCLHLKSAVTAIGPKNLLAAPLLVDVGQFRDFDVVLTMEPDAANALRLGEVLVHSAKHAATRRELERRGYKVQTVNISEMEKAEAGVTCCSLIM